MPRLMSSTLPETTLRTEGERGSDSVRRARQEEMRLDDIAAKEAEKREAIRVANERAALESLAPVFKAAVERWGKAEAYASEIGITKSTLSEMCSGKRLIGPRDWMPLRSVPEAWALWTRGVASAGGLDVAVNRKPVMSMSRLRNLIAEIVIEDADKDGALGNWVLNEAAKRGGVEREDVDSVVERGEQGDDEQPTEGVQ